MGTLRDMNGVGPKREKLLNKLGIHRPYDFLYFFPRAYEDRSVFSHIADAKIGDTLCISATLSRDFVHSRLSGGRSMSRADIFDETGRMSVVFFNQKYMADKLEVGGQYIFYGKVGGTPYKKELVNPSVEDFSDYDPNGRILPIYSLCEGLTQNYMRKLSNAALEEYIAKISDPLSGVAASMKLLGLCDALYNIHFPKNHKLQQYARKRLMFDELFYLMLGMSVLKNRQKENTSVRLDGNVDMYPFYNALSFEPTDAQRRVISECERDLKKGVPMNRLVQGDVGCGKTTVAQALIYRCVKCGYQAAFMAPTEVLARQQYENMSNLFSRFGINAVLLTGSLSAKLRKEAEEQIESGYADVIIGTHALITEGVKFFRLGLAVTDEQHRFGVRQRAALIGKGDGVHTLVMSATPIPRTLGLIMYGDLDISVIDELPKGRMKVDTFLVGQSMRNRAYNFVRKQAEMGFSSYIICPAVEEGEGHDISSVMKLYSELKDGALKGIKLGILYGKMKPYEKNEVMERFASGQIQALISTTVVEVGVDIKNASLIIIEDADRFGLSQLHQLRGRVGRSSNKSYCIMISDSKNEQTRERLKTLTKTNDGFEIAEADLKLRGPGDFLGNRQHGLPFLRLAEITDMDMIELAKSASEKLLNEDPALSDKAHVEILEKIEEMFFDSSKKNTFN